MAVPSKKKGSAKREERKRSKAASARTRSRRSHGMIDDDDDDDDEEFDNSATVANLESRYGSAKAALAQVQRERHRETQRRKRLRARVEELEDELDDLHEHLGISADTELPDNAVIMSKDDADELTAYRALSSETDDPKKQFEDIKKKVEEHGTLVQKAADADARSLREAAAKAAGGWDADILADLLKVLELDLEMREVEQEGGEKVKVPFVKVRGKEGVEPSRLSDFVEKDERAKKYIPALTATSDSTGDQHDSSRRAGGTFVPRTSGGGQRPNTDVVASTLGSRYVPPSKRNAGGDK